MDSFFFCSFLCTWNSKIEIFYKMIMEFIYFYKGMIREKRYFKVKITKMTLKTVKTLLKCAKLLFSACSKKTHFYSCQLLWWSKKEYRGEKIENCHLSFILTAFSSINENVLFYFSHIVSTTRIPMHFNQMRLHMQSNEHEFAHCQCHWLMIESNFFARCCCFSLFTSVWSWQTSTDWPYKLQVKRQIFFSSTNLHGFN